MFHWLKKLTRKRYVSPNFNERGGQAPHMVIIHYTGMKTAVAALERLCDPAAEVSAHYLIEEDGFVHALVPEEKRAWHAGVSHWQGLSDINAASIGIELVNTGHEFGYAEFSAKQMKALLGGYGYDVSVEPETLVEAYHRRFYPEKFMGDGNPKEIDILSVARLLSLVRQAHEGAPKL